MRNRSIFAGLGLVLALAVAVPAWAGHGEIPRNRASLQVEAVREVENDWATARLNVFAEGKSAAAVARRVNEAMARVVARAKKEDDVDRRSGGYTTNPAHMPKGHREQEAWNPDRLIHWASTVGPEVAALDFEVRPHRQRLEDAFVSAINLVEPE